MLVERIYLVSKTIRWSNDLLNYAIADGLYKLLFPIKQVSDRSRRIKALIFNSVSTSVMKGAEYKTQETPVRFSP